MSGLSRRRAVDELRARIEEVHQEIVTDPAPLGEVPLHLACYSTACCNGLHCLDFIRTGRAGAVDRTPVAKGQCRACLNAIAAFPDHPAQNVDEVVALFDQQRKELIREHYWTAPMDRWAFNQAYRRGRLGLHQWARKVLSERIGGAKPYRDGRQTPWHKDVIAYAQHAVAACCRHCVQYWHAIPTGRALEPAELDHLTALVTLYLDLRFPGLPDEPSNPGTITIASLPDGGDPFDLRQRLAGLLAGGMSPAGLVVPRVHFKVLKTDVRVDDSGGSVELRGIGRQLDFELGRHTGTG